MANNLTNRNKLEQGRAEFAFQMAQEGIASEGKAYKSYVEKLPMLIKTNGLGAAMAFSLYKDKSSKIVYQQVEQWLKKDHKQLVDLSNKRLAEKLTEIYSSEYRAVTVEVMAFLDWLRKFAKGLTSDN